MIIADVLQSLLLAQAGSPGAAPQPGPFDGLVTIGGPLLMFAVIYFLMIRPASQQRRKHADLLSKLKVDDEVITTGGIVGKIVRVEDSLLTLEIADKVKVRVLRDRVTGRFVLASKPKQ